MVLLYGHLNKRLADSLVTKNKFLLTISIIFKEKRHEKKEKCQLGGTCLIKHQNLRIKVMINVFVRENFHMSNFFLNFYNTKGNRVNSIIFSRFMGSIDI